MKQIIMLALMLVFVGTALSQNTSQLNMGQVGPTAERARLFKTTTNFTNSTGDTTGYVTINVPGWTSDPLLMPTVRLWFVYTDSVKADIYVIGRNGTLTTAYTNSNKDNIVTYADSVIDNTNTANPTGAHLVTLRDHLTERCAGCTQFKVGIVYRSAGNGTTANRTMKAYIQYIKP